MFKNYIFFIILCISYLSIYFYCIHKINKIMSDLFEEMKDPVEEMNRLIEELKGE